MAGAYPDVPAHRFAWDRDCAALWIPNTGAAPRVLTAAERKLVNDETPGSGLDMSGDHSTHGAFAVLFPSARDVVGHFIAGNQLNSDSYQFEAAFETSTNTSDGRDGTWTRQTAAYLAPLVPVPDYRTGIKVIVSGATPTPATGVIGVRWVTAGSWSPWIKSAHLYGTLPAAGTRLAFWHPSQDQVVSGAHFDFGTVAQGTTASISFRIKNLSTLTASSITVAEDSPTDTSPSLLQQYEVRNSDGSLAVLGVGTELSSLGPGAVSPVYNLVRTTAANAQVGLGVLRLIAAAGTWS